MKTKLLILIIVVLGSIGFMSCTPQDAMTDDLYTGDHHPASDNTYDLGRTTYRWANLYAVNINGAPFVPGVVAPHNLLSVTHADTTAGGVVRGDLITGQGVAATWSRLAIGGVGTFLSSDGTDSSWRVLQAADIPSLSGTYVPYLGATAAVDLGAQNFTTTGLVGIGTPPAANNLISVLYNAGGLASVTALDVSENSASAGARGIDISVAGAKTANTWGMSLFNGATSGTNGVDKYGLSILSTGVWNGAAANNYALYINEATGGTANYTIYTVGGSHYFGGNTSINGTLNMNTHQINNVVDPTLAQDAATKNYVDTGLGGIYVPYNGATGNIDLNAKEVTNGIFNNIVTKGTWTASGVWTIPAVTLGGTVSINGQTFSGAASFDNTVTLPNNTYLRYLDSTAVAKNILTLDNSNQVLLESPSANLKLQSNSDKDIASWGGGYGTGRSFQINATNASAGTTTQDSPTLLLNARYWTGAASASWNYTILNDMTASGATPASTVTHKINAVSVMDLTNTNATITGRLYGTWAIGAAAVTYTNLFSTVVVNDPTETKYGIIGGSFIAATTGNNANQIIGIHGNPQIRNTNNKNWTNTYAVIGVNGQAELNASATGTITGMVGVRGWVRNLTAAGGIVTNGYVFYGLNPTATGQITNVYGLYLESMTSGTTLNYAIYSAGGQSYHAGNLGLGQTSPTAVLHIKAGTATASTSPVKLTTGTLLTVPEAGAIEYTTPRLYYTDGGSIRQTLVPDAYGQLYEDSAGSTITVVSAGTYYQWSTSTAGDYHLNTLSTANDNITVDSGGDGEYRISYSVSYSASANDTVHWAIYHTPSGGAATKLANISSETYISNTNVIMCCSSVGLKSLGAGDTIDLRVTSTTNGTTITVNHVSITMERVAR